MPTEASSRQGSAPTLLMQRIPLRTPSRGFQSPRSFHRSHSSSSQWPWYVPLPFQHQKHIHQTQPKDKLTPASPPAPTAQPRLPPRLLPHKRRLRHDLLHALHDLRLPRGCLLAAGAKQRRRGRQADAGRRLFRLPCLSPRLVPVLRADDGCCRHAAQSSCF